MMFEAIKRGYKPDPRVPVKRGWFGLIPKTIMAYFPKINGSTVTMMDGTKYSVDYTGAYRRVIRAKSSQRERRRLYGRMRRRAGLTRSGADRIQATEARERMMAVMETA